MRDLKRPSVLAEQLRNVKLDRVPRGIRKIHRSISRLGYITEMSLSLGELESLVCLALRTLPSENGSLLCVVPSMQVLVGLVL